MARKKRDSGGEDDGADRWLGTYGDAITLLMAFFVMLYAMSEVDAQKFESFLAGLAEPFGNQAGGQALLAENTAIVGPAAPPQPVPDAAAEALSVLQQQMTNEPSPTPSSSPSDGDGDKAPEDLAKVREELAKALAEAGVPSAASYRYDERGLVVSMSAENVLFASGSTTISPLGERVMATIAAALRGFPNPILIEGHTDNVPLHRARYTNWNLSTDRAVSVLSSLVERHGIGPNRVGAVGYGEYRPLASNANPQGRALNRRVDLLVMQGGE